MRRFSFFLACLLLFSQCSSDNSVSSSRSIERMIIGTWILPKPDFVGSFIDYRHIIFNSDGTFSAPWGIAGPLLLEYNGHFWTQGPFLGARGPGGFVGEGRLHVQFAHLELTDWTDPDALGVQITEVLPEYVATLGFGSPDDMSASDVRKVLGHLNDNPLPTNAWGDVKTFQKIEFAFPSAD